MPGTPPTSPRFGVSRYADTDEAEFSAQTNAITDGFDAAVARRLVPNLLTGSATVADHEVVVATANETVTLPVPTSEHELICVYAKDDTSGVSGSAPVTVDAGSGAKIYGKGLGTSGATSFKLGTPGAFAWLFSYDGTNWRIIHGEQDTGWVPLALANGCADAAGAYAPAYRQCGSRVELQGAFQVPSGGLSSSTAVATNLPAPSGSIEMACSEGGSTTATLTIAASSTSLATTITNSLSSLAAVWLDGRAYFVD